MAERVRSSVCVAKRVWRCAISARSSGKVAIFGAQEKAVSGITICNTSRAHNYLNCSSSGFPIVSSELADQPRPPDLAAVHSHRLLSPVAAHLTSACFCQREDWFLVMPCTERVFGLAKSVPSVDRFPGGLPALAFGVSRSNSPARRSARTLTSCTIRSRSWSLTCVSRIAFTWSIEWIAWTTTGIGS